jgi:hypothetical protein
VEVGEAVTPVWEDAAVGKVVAPGGTGVVVGEAVMPAVEQAARLIRRSTPIKPFEINLRGLANGPGSGLGEFVEGKIMEWGFYQNRQN